MLKLSGLREDTPFLKVLLNCRDAEMRSFGAHQAKLPLMVVPRDIVESIEKDGKTWTCRDTILSELDFWNVVLEMPQNFAFITGDEDGAASGVVAHNLVGPPSTEADKLVITSTIKVKATPGETKFLEQVVDTFGSDFGSYVETVGVIEGSSFRAVMASDPRLTPMRESIESVASNMMIAFASAVMMHHIATREDKYPVLVTPEKTDKPKKGSGPTAKKLQVGPRLIYLNRLPSPKKPAQGGTHASPIRHQRRGHYKTLKHPKFANHPKYGVERGVYVRPAWVGEKEVVVEGNRYTVILNEQLALPL